MLLRNTIYTVSLLMQEDRSTQELTEIFGCSAVTVKRIVAEARRMGADIGVLVTHENGYRYHLKNLSEVKLVVRNWQKVMSSADSIKEWAYDDNIFLKPEAVVAIKA